MMVHHNSVITGGTALYHVSKCRKKPVTCTSAGITRDGNLSLSECTLSKPTPPLVDPTLWNLIGPNFSGAKVSPDTKVLTPGGWTPVRDLDAKPFSAFLLCNWFEFEKTSKRPAQPTFTKIMSEPKAWTSKSSALGKLHSLAVAYMGKSRAVNTLIGGHRGVMDMPTTQMDDVQDGMALLTALGYRYKTLVKDGRVTFLINGKYAQPTRLAKMVRTSPVFDKSLVVTVHAQPPFYGSVNGLFIQ